MQHLKLRFIIRGSSNNFEKIWKPFMENMNDESNTTKKPKTISKKMLKDAKMLHIAQ